MKLWIYAKSSHRDSLDNVRRCSAIANALEEFEPTLCTGDYRATCIARDTMGVKNAMGIDAMGNLPHTMERLDMLIYDNEDVTKEMHQQMTEYCSKLYALTDTLPLDIVDNTYFMQSDFSIKKALFFRDDDYTKWFFDFCKDSKKYELPLVNGNYFFLDTQKEFEKSFSEIIDEEEYEDIIKYTEYLLSASVHTCLESLASGNKPIFFMPDDKGTRSFELIQKYNIPVVNGKNLDELMQSYERIIANYPQTKKIEKFDFSAIKEEIAMIFEEYKHISPSLDFTHEYA